MDFKMLLNNNITNIEKNFNFDEKKLHKNIFSLQHLFTEINCNLCDEKEIDPIEFKKDSFSNFVGELMYNNQKKLMSFLNYNQIKEIINDFSPSRARNLLDKSKLSNDEIIKLIEIFKAKKSLLSHKFFTNSDNIELLKKIENTGFLKEEEFIKSFKSYDYFYEKSNKHQTSSILYQNKNVKTETISNIIDNLYIIDDDLERFKSDLSSNIIDLENFVDYFFNDFKEKHIEKLIQNPNINEKIIKKLLNKKTFSLKFLKVKLSEEFVLENYKLLNLEDIVSINNFDESFHIKLLNKMDEKEREFYFGTTLFRKTKLNFSSYEKIMKEFNYKLDPYYVPNLILEDTSEKFLIKNLNIIDNNISKRKTEKNSENLNKELKNKYDFFKKVLINNNNREKIIEKNIDFIMDNDKLFSNLIYFQSIPTKILNDKIINNEKLVNSKLKDELIKKQNIFSNKIFEKIKGYDYGENVNILIANNKYFWLNKNNKEILSPTEHNINTREISNSTLVFISKIYTNNENIELQKTKKFILSDDISLN